MENHCPCFETDYSSSRYFYAVGHWNDYFNPLIYLKSGSLKPIQIYLRGILIANDSGLTNTGGEIGLEQKYLFEALKFAVIVITVLPITVIYPFSKSIL